MKRSGFSNKRKYVYLHESNTSADSPSFSFILKTNKYYIEDKHEFPSNNYHYVVEYKKDKYNDSIVTFFISFNK